jgi:hypothetical protein
MPTDAANVCLSGKIGSDERTLKTALLTRFGHQRMYRCAILSQTWAIAVLRFPIGRGTQQ